MLNIDYSISNRPYSPSTHTHTRTKKPNVLRKEENPQQLAVWWGEKISQKKIKPKSFTQQLQQNQMEPGEYWSPLHSRWGRWAFSRWLGFSKVWGQNEAPFWLIPADLFLLVILFDLGTEPNCSVDFEKCCQRIAAAASPMLGKGKKLLS